MGFPKAMEPLSNCRSSRASMAAKVERWAARRRAAWGRLAGFMNRTSEIKNWRARVRGRRQDNSGLPCWVGVSPIGAMPHDPREAMGVIVTNGRDFCLGGALVAENARDSKV